MDDDATRRKLGIDKKCNQKNLTYENDRVEINKDNHKHCQHQLQPNMLTELDNNFIEVNIENFKTKNKVNKDNYVFKVS